MIYRTKPKLVTETLYTPKMQVAFKEAFAYLEFSDDLIFQTLVVPSAGLTTIEASENGQIYGTLTDGTDIDVALADYTRPSALGMIVSIRATPSVGTPITGAVYWRMVVARY